MDLVLDYLPLAMAGISFGVIIVMMRRSDQLRQRFFGSSEYAFEPSTQFAGERVASGSLPAPASALIAGLALLGSIGGGLAVALKDDAHREAALITFLVTLSGFQLLGIGSAFWGVAAGALALFVQQWRPRWTA